jgi:hypothetical protein
MIITKNSLFTNIGLSEQIQWLVNNIDVYLDAISIDQFSVNSDDQIAEFIFSKMELVPLKINRDNAFISKPKETKYIQKDPLDREIKNSGVSIEYSLPYSGTSNLWRMRPSRFGLNFPKGEFIPKDGNDQIGVVRFEMQFPIDDYRAENVKEEIDKNLQNIDEYISYSTIDIESSTPQLHIAIKEKVVQRRNRLGVMKTTTELLNIPISLREEAPDLIPLQLLPKITPSLNKKGQQAPEYGILNEDYENILKVIRHEGCSYERTPEPFAKHDEEELRDILMSHLNGHYNGLANGEAFRKKGKTDICIEFENRAAFVAECKLWNGDQKLSESVEQLLGYLTWRDCKTSLIIFDKDVAGFKQIQEKIPAVLKQHPYFVREEKAQHPGEWRMAFRSSEDPDRVISVYVFLFNLFVSKY